MSCEFHLHLTCNSRVFIFQKFFCQFFYPKCDQIRFKFWPVMQYKVMHQKYDGFYFILKKHLKLSQKADFLAHFEKFFDYTLLCPPSYAPIFCQSKGLIVIHNHGKFHQCSICGSQVINFQMFSWQCSTHEMASFGGFLSPFSPKYGSILLKLCLEVVYHKKKAVCKQCFKIMCLSTNWTYPKFTVLVYFWTQFTPRKS